MESQEKIYRRDKYGAPSRFWEVNLSAKDDTNTEQDYKKIGFWFCKEYTDEYNALTDAEKEKAKKRNFSHINLVKQF